METAAAILLLMVHQSGEQNYLTISQWTPSFVQKSFHPDPVPSNYKGQACLELLFSPDRFLANAYDLNQIRAYLDESYRLYAKITAPVSLIYGDQDQVIYQFSHAAGFAYKVPHAKYIMLPNTGHLLHFFHQKVVVEEIERIRNTQVPEG